MDSTTLFNALILGLIEGLTEFIPVSSTGHLILLGDLLDFKGPEGHVFEIIIQLGAILAVCWVYKQKLISVLFGLSNNKKAQHFAASIIIAFLPAAVIGALFHDVIKEVLFSPTIVSISLIVGGIIIILIEKTARTFYFFSIDSITLKTSFLIGLAQCIAMIPGVSRSGATIMGSLLLGVDSKTATEFSFFLAIPTMFGATVFDVYKNYHVFSFDNVLVILIGFFSAFFAALLVVRFVINFISHHGFIPFAYYRIIVGTIMLCIMT